MSDLGPNKKYTVSYDVYGENGQDDRRLIAEIVPPLTIDIRDILEEELRRRRLEVDDIKTNEMPHSTWVAVLPKPHDGEIDDTSAFIGAVKHVLSPTGMIEIEIVQPKQP